MLIDFVGCRLSSLSSSAFSLSYRRLASEFLMQHKIKTKLKILLRPFPPDAITNFCESKPVFYLQSSVSLYNNNKFVTFITTNCNLNNGTIFLTPSNTLTESLPF